MNRPSVRTLSPITIGLAAAFLPALCFGAQAGKGSASPKPPAAILGIRPGMDLDDAHELLQKLGGVSAASQAKGLDNQDAHTKLQPAPNRDADQRDADTAVPAKDKDAARPKQAAADEDSDEGHQEAWKLRGTPYATLALASDDKGHVLWITGFARPGKELPFAQLGDTKQTAALSPSFAVWNVIIPHKSYRVVARGKGGKASVITMLTLAQANPNGIFSPQVVSPSRR